MARGDRIDVLIDKGGGQSEWLSVEADKAGRTLQVLADKRAGDLEIEVLTRGGTSVRKNVFRLDRVISYANYHVDADAEDEDGA